MVGTAVYQVGVTSVSQAKNFSALKPGVQKTLAPAASEPATAAIRPWIWKSGMMLRQRSSGVSASAAATLWAEAARLAWLSGTSLGREVVPDVCSRSAMSSSLATPVATAGPTDGPSIEKVPAGSLASKVSRRTAMPSLSATAIAGPASSLPTRIALAPMSER